MVEEFCLSSSNTLVKCYLRYEFSATIGILIYASHELTLTGRDKMGYFICLCHAMHEGETYF